MKSFRIKICGVTNIADAVAAVEMGADAIGLNFFSESKRYVAPQMAAEICAALPAKTSKVGVFVNLSAPEVAAIAEQAKLDFVQLHGDETPSQFSQLGGQLTLIRAIRVPAAPAPKPSDAIETLQQFVQPQIDEWTRAGAAAILLDAAQPGQYGGTGTTFPWALVPALNTALPIVLAGGLAPETVANAIFKARPAAVDVASRVEKSPGIKDHRAMEHFIHNAREAFNTFGAQLRLGPND